MSACNSARKTTVLVFLLALLSGVPWPGCIRTAQAQTTGEADDVPYTFVLVGVPLKDALDTLIDKTLISLVYPTELVEGKTTFCRAYRQTQESVLACILHGTGLDYARLSSGTYVLFADPRTPPRYGRLAGRVTDADTGEPLADANILLADDGTGTATNQAGRFALAALKPGPHRLVVTHVAYHDLTDTVWVAPDAGTRVTLSMKARTLLTAPVVISGFTSRMPSEDLGQGRRTALELADGFETNAVARNIDAIVGVRAGDALSDVHVQGGATGEHQFLLDGATVFIPIRNGGFFGPFSPFAVQQVTVQKAGFEAAHGSYLSGVIEVEHRVAPSPKKEVVVQVDDLSLNGRVSGKTTIKERLKASWMVAGRTGLWELYKPQPLQDLFQSWSAPDRFLAGALQHPDDMVPAADTATIASEHHPIELDFSDLHAAVRFQLDGLHSLHASFYRGRNTFGDDLNLTPTPDQTPPAGKTQEQYLWTNITSQVHYEGVLSSRVFVNAGVWISSYEFLHPFDRFPFAPVDSNRIDVLPPEDFNDIEEVGLRAGWDYAATARHFLSGNVEGAHTNSVFALSIDPFAATPSLDAENTTLIKWRWSSFLEDRWALNLHATLTPGLRLTYLPALQTVYAEPRLSFRYDHGQGRRGRWAFRGAAGIYRQFINQFDVATYNTTALVPSVRFWLPLSTEEHPSKAYHVTGAFTYMPDDVWTFGVESFYKYHPHLLVLDYGSAVAPPEASSSRTLLTEAKGYAYGVAVTAGRTTRTTHLTAQYEYAMARRRVANRFDGAYVTVPWNTPHRLFVSMDVTPRPHWTATLRWQGIAGRAWGFRQAYYDYLEPNPDTQLFTPYDLSDPEAHRLPFFSQWDVGLAYSHALAGFGVQARLNFINVFGRTNVRDWSLYYDETSASYVRTPRRATPFIPSFSLRVTR